MPHINIDYIVVILSSKYVHEKIAAHIEVLYSPFYVENKMLFN